MLGAGFNAAAFNHAAASAGSGCKRGYAGAMRDATEEQQQDRFVERSASLARTRVHHHSFVTNERKMTACSYRQFVKLGLAAAMLALSSIWATPAARAGTPYEAQIGGFMSASLQTIITGEFAGRSPSNADAIATRRICLPGDYDDLRASAHDRAAFDAFHKRCDLVEFTVDASQVHAVAYLPSGSCETLKKVWDAMMVDHIHAVPPGAGPWVIFEYKGSRYEATQRHLARGAQLRSSCQADGSLRITGPRKRPR